MRHPVSACCLVVLCAATLSVAQPTNPLAGASLDELIEIIHKGNAYQRTMAISPLSRIKDPRVIPELGALLKDPDASVRLSVAQLLSQYPDERVADAMAEALADDLDEVRQHAAEGLLRVGSERHVPALVASVMNHLPSPDKMTNNRSWHSAPAIAAIGKLSSKAPSEFIELIRGIAPATNAADEDWWQVRESVAGCLGQIGDKTAIESLKEARAVLETECQDYRTWFAVRKALAAVDPQAGPFDRPAADILRQIQWGKGGFNGMGSLVQLGVPALDDLAWMLHFEGQQDRQRVSDALLALGKIGSEKARGILRNYIAKSIERQAKSQADASPRLPNMDAQTQRREESLCQALAALLNAEADEPTAHEVFLIAHHLTGFTQSTLVSMVSGLADDMSRQNVATAFYADVLIGSPQAKPLSPDAGRYAADHLARIGGQRAGEALGKALLASTTQDAGTAAAEALRIIRNYDAIPVLMEASRLPNTPKDAIAYAMGAIRDERAVPSLRDLMGRNDLTKNDRLWTAAALARMGIDYDENARLLRDALPDSLEQTRWLHDKETIVAVARFVPPDKQDTAFPNRPRVRGRRLPSVCGYFTVSEQAISVLMSIGTTDALDAMISTADLETVNDTLHLMNVSSAIANLAGRLQHPAQERWATACSVMGAVRELFGIRLSQAPSQPAWARRDVPEAIDRDPALARRVWIAELDRQLNGTPGDRFLGSKVEFSAAVLYAAERIFGPELIPSLEQLAKQNESVRTFRGKDALIKHYYIRSLAARILTEKTGQAYTFVDADGQTHPGGWDPSQEGAR
jgi:HEAT repeat protein